MPKSDNIILNCSKCSSAIHKGARHLSCFLCESSTHREYVDSPATVIDNIMKPSSPFAFVCTKCKSSKLAKKSSGYISQKKQKSQQSIECDVKPSDQTDFLQSKFSGLQPNDVSLTTILEHIKLLQDSFQSISMEHARMSSTVKILESNYGAISGTLVRNGSTHSMSTTSAYSSCGTSFNFPYKNAPNFAQTDQHLQCTEFTQIPPNDSQNQAAFTIEAIPHDDTRHTPHLNCEDSFETGTIKKIGVPSCDPNQIVNEMINRNRWLHIKFFRIDRIYKTASSYTNSYNCIATFDMQAYQDCINHGALIFAKHTCKLYNHTQ